MLALLKRYSSSKRLYPEDYEYMEKAREILERIQVYHMEATFQSGMVPTNNNNGGPAYKNKTW